MITFIEGETLPQGLGSDSSGKTDNGEADRLLSFFVISEGPGKPEVLRIFPPQGDTALSWGT